MLGGIPPVPLEERILSLGKDHIDCMFSAFDAVETGDRAFVKSCADGLSNRYRFFYLGWLALHV